MASVAKALMEKHTRPRRLESDHLNYLKQVPEMIVDMEDEEQELLLWNVVEEVGKRAASAASERNSCELVEFLVDKITNRQLRYLLSMCEGYTMHLWTNRYSSHVLQKMFSKMSTILEGECEEDWEEEDDGRDIPTLTEIVVNMCQEIEVDILDMMQDVSASHVIRSVLCVLRGSAPIVEKRGKHGKHRAISFENKRMDKFNVPSELRAVFQGYVEKMLNAPNAQWRELVVDVHAGPVLSMMLRLMTAEEATKMLTVMVHWDQQEKCKRVVYDLSADSVASHFMEAIVDACDDEMLIYFYESCLKGSLMEFAEHQVANYVVQHFVDKIQTKELATDVIGELLQAVDLLFGYGRPGVVWKLAQASQKFNVLQQQVLDAIVDAKVKESRDKLIVKLLALRLPNEQEPQAHVDVSGAHIVRNMLLFKEDVALKVFNCIVELDEKALLAIAQNGSGSRCIVEPIFESKYKSVRGIQKKIVEKFQGSFGMLANTRFGVFTVIKAFAEMKIKYKTIIVQELALVDSILSGSHFGRLALKECKVQEFKQRRETWEDQFTKKKKLQNMFSDMLPAKDGKVAVKQDQQPPLQVKRPNANVNLDFISDALDLTTKDSRKKARKQL